MITLLGFCFLGFAIRYRTRQIEGRMIIFARINTIAKWETELIFFFSSTGFLSPSFIFVVAGMADGSVFDVCAKILVNIVSILLINCSERVGRHRVGTNLQKNQSNCMTASIFEINEKKNNLPNKSLAPSTNGDPLPQLRQIQEGPPFRPQDAR